MNRFIHDRLQRFPFGRDANHAPRRGFDQRNVGTPLERKVVWLDDITGTDDNRALDDVLELADIARPTMAFQRCDRVLAQTQVLPALTFGVAAYEIVGEDRNVPFPLTQRRKLEPCNVKSIEEISAEAVVGYRRLQGRVCPCDNACVKSAFFRAAQSAETSVFDDP